MSPLYFFNTASRNIEEFKSIEQEKVRMYSCGPTVYDFVHIGNLRSFFLSDIIRRTLELNGYNVLQIMNITDVGHLVTDGDSGDDKMSRGLERENLPFTIDGMKMLADKYSDAFLHHITLMNIKTPHVLPRASEHIEEDIEIILKLQKKNVVYETSDGLYFEVSLFPQYGLLRGSNHASHENDESKHARIHENTEKRSQKDFAVWKFDQNLGYESPFGKGFPGWHIECSSMSWKYLGEHFDIHTGGADLIDTHHTNEIAQSETVHGTSYVNYWLHNAFINVADAKMSKSLGTGYTLETLIEQGIHPLSYRMWLLTAHYRSQINFSIEAVLAVQTARQRLVNSIRRITDCTSGSSGSSGSQEKIRTTSHNEINSSYRNRFLTHINNDLDTPSAIALVWELLKDSEMSDITKISTLKFFDEFLGLDIFEITTTLQDVPQEVRELAILREDMRKYKKWDEADRIRKEIEQRGYDLQDTDDGFFISEKI